MSFFGEKVEIEHLLEMLLERYNANCPMLFLINCQKIISMRFFFFF